MEAKNIIRELCPPILWRGLSAVRRRIARAGSSYSSLKIGATLNPHHVSQTGQDLAPYWDSAMAEVLEKWGEGNAWSEIQFLMASSRGRVLDIACGTGKVMELLSRYINIEVYGCDISDFLIQRAVDRGIPRERLSVCDATRTGYDDNTFDLAYSIGSLEHFTGDGITNFVAECYRITRSNSFHMLPVSRSGENEGWVKLTQSYHNNSVKWWLEKFGRSYKSVCVLDSRWEDSISVGKWFVCFK